MTQPPQGGQFPPPSGPPFGAGQPQPDAPYGTPGPAPQYGGAPGYPPPPGTPAPPPGYGAPVPPPVSGAPGSGAPVSPSMPGGPYPPAGYPAPAGGAYPPGGPFPPGYPAPAPPRKKRGLLIASIIVVVALLLCAGGGTAAFFLLRGADPGEGADEPTTAVQEFLTAVYQDRNAGRATDLVCSSSRDREKIAAKVAEVEKYVAEYDTPRFRWTAPAVADRTDERATVTTKVTVTTADEKVADQELRFTVIRETGWWVCEVG
ncbi:hypothetical protein Misp04_51510 [Micromonospora sp. NBRC 101691]|nr:hypothetical protein [Micromonospora sp. NBRC 101691]GLY25420.1 hypothetical protein Misp04_51510 [Micromonospora sp. NBRC 101691]